MIETSSQQVTVTIIEESEVQVIYLGTEPVVEFIEIGVVGPQGPPGPPGPSASFLSDLQDVDVADRTDGSVFYYDAALGKFVADSIETRITLTDGGNF